MPTDMIDQAEVEDWGVIKTTTKEPDIMRLIKISDAILDMRERTKADLVAIEGYSYGAINAREKMGELSGVIKFRLFEEDIPYLVFPPLTWRKVVLGKAIGRKDEVAMLLTQRYPIWGIDNVDAIEAAGVAACAQIFKMTQPEDWKQYQKDAFKKLNIAIATGER